MMELPKNWFPTFRRTWHGVTNWFAPGTTAAHLWTRPDQRTLLRFMSICARHRIPLAPLLDQVANDSGGSIGIRLKKLAGLLEGEVPLPIALEQCPALAPCRTVLAVRTGIESGTLAASIDAVLDEPREVEVAPDEFEPRRHVAYLVMLLCAIACGVLFWFQKIVPTLLQLLYDCHIEPPSVLTNGVAVVDSVLQWIGILAIAGMAITIWYFYRRITTRKRGSPVDRWWFSPFGKEVGDILRILGVVSNSGRPLGRAMSTIARYHDSPAMRQRLLFVHNELLHGAELWPTLQEVGMIGAPERRLLESATRVGNVGWVLRQLARRRDDRLSELQEAVRRVITPVCVVLLGLGVLCLTLAVIAPLVTLVEGSVPW